jgi:hypothetical protein
MSNTFEILNPVRRGKLADGTEVTVSELPWALQDEALDRIVTQLNALFKPGQGTIELGGMTLSLETIVNAVKDTSALSHWLVLHTTGLSAERIAKLSVTERFVLLEHAIDLNVVGYMAGTKKSFGRITNSVGKNAAAPTPAPPSPAT